jgi:RHS repeat-associated protein
MIISQTNSHHSTGANTRSLGYTTNALNQYTNLITPPIFYLTGTAPASDPVTVNGTAANRQGDYFWKEITTTPLSTPRIDLITISTNDIPGSPGPRAFLTGSHTYPPQNVSPSYDMDGNLTADGLCTYQWDEENRLIKATSTLNSSSYTTYIYDYQSRLVRRTFYGAGENEIYLYDGWNRIAEFTNTYQTPNNLQLRTSYTWGTDLSGTMQGAGGVGGLLWGRFFATPSQPLPSNQIYGYDGNGNVTSLVNASTGQTSAQYTYGPFGELLTSIGPMAKTNCYRFSTKPQDDFTGLLYYGYRYYDPQSGRWPSRDPIQEAGSINLYGYVGNNPINAVDALGLMPLASPATAQAWAPTPPGSAANVGGHQAVTFMANAIAAEAVAAVVLFAAPEAVLLALRNPAATAAGGAAAGGAADKFRRVPINLLEQLTLEAAKRGEGIKIIDRLGDPCFKDMEKWQLVTKSAEGLKAVVHYVRDPATGKLMDFKFK